MVKEYGAIYFNFFICHSILNNDFESLATNLLNTDDHGRHYWFDIIHDSSDGLFFFFLSLWVLQQYYNEENKAEQKTRPT